MGYARPLVAAGVLTASGNGNGNGNGNGKAHPNGNGNGSARPAVLPAVLSTLDNKIREARLKGYEGDACRGCGQFHPGPQRRLPQVRQLR